MLTLNLEAIGVTEEALEGAILGELGMTREEAVAALAEKFGVNVGGADVVNDGDTVPTGQGEAVGRFVTEEEIATLRGAAAIQARIFG